MVVLEDYSSVFFNWYPKPPECRHQLGLEPQRRVLGSPHYHGSQISGPGYAASQFSYRRRIRRVPLKLQRCPTWYHRAQLQQSVSGHTNAFFDGLSDRAVRHTRYRHKRWPY
nr:hypothetical protein WS3_00186 [Pantoea sp.]